MTETITIEDAANRTTKWYPNGPTGTDPGQQYLGFLTDGQLVAWTAREVIDLMDGVTVERLAADWQVRAMLHTPRPAVQTGHADLDLWQIQAGGRRRRDRLIFAHTANDAIGCWIAAEFPDTPDNAETRAEIFGTHHPYARVILGANCFDQSQITEGVLDMNEFQRLITP